MRNAFLAAPLCALLALATSGCGLLYKVDVYQGNMLDERNVAQLREGMSKRQVLSLLGTPSIRDPFNADRWDYLATMAERGSEPDVRNLVLIFNGDSLASFEGDYFPKQDNELRLRMARYGNLPREERQRRGR
ncbi:MAG: outer membrane protein assembly factor BamE [Aquimonas sp.]|nr:outer membrane protein assembly factor BamE [Aquimonas sp.]